MNDNTKQVLKWLGASEGGYVNHPDDPGGPTNMGVTQRTYNAWRRAQGQDGHKSVRHITREEADNIFVYQYFRPIWFDKLPAGLDYAMADFSVNSGPKRAVKFLQRIVGTKVDGVMGLHTLAAVNGRKPQDLIVALCNNRLRWMKTLRTWRTFGRGWEARVMGRTKGVQAKDIGVIDRASRMASGASKIPAPKPAPHRAKPTSRAPAWVRWLARLKR